MQKVIIESPYAGNIADNETYARQCVAHSLSLGECPFASHLFYTQPGVLDDTRPEQRRRGIECGFEWAKSAQLTAVYLDRGISKGMHSGVMDALCAKRPTVFRFLDGGPRVTGSTWAFQMNIFGKLSVVEYRIFRECLGDPRKYLIAL